VRDSEILKWATMRTADQPFFLGYDLNEYRIIHDATEDDLASLLDCPRNALVCLSLCRRPYASGPSFRRDVEQIASHCGVNAQRLAKLIREVDSLRTMREVDMPEQIGHSVPGLLAAARERKMTPRRRGRKRPRK
jgi:hypothetical protein